MTKTELHNKHQALLKSETIVLLADVAAHMRRGAPLTPPNMPLDRDTTARKLGVMEGWQYACEYLHNLHIPQVQQEAQQPARPYSEPSVVAKPEAQPK